MLIGSEIYDGTGKLGLVISQLYKRNTKDLTNYKFGDVFTGMALLSKRWKGDNLNVSLSGGIQFEFQTEDEQGEQIVKSTRKDGLLGVVKADLN